MAVLAVLVLGTLAGALYGTYRGYTQWRQTRLLRQTRDYLAKADVRQAVLTIKQAVQNSPNDPATCRLMAEVAERAGSGVAVYYRQRLAELEPPPLPMHTTIEPSHSTPSKGSFSWRLF